MTLAIKLAIIAALILLQYIYSIWLFSSWREKKKRYKEVLHLTLFSSSGSL